MTGLAILSALPILQGTSSLDSVWIESSRIHQKIPHFWGLLIAQSLGTGGPPKMGDFLTNQTNAGILKDKFYYNYSLAYFKNHETSHLPSSIVIL